LFLENRFYIVPGKDLEGFYIVRSNFFYTSFLQQNNNSAIITSFTLLEKQSRDVLEKGRWDHLQRLSSVNILVENYKIVALVSIKSHG